MIVWADWHGSGNLARLPGVLFVPAVNIASPQPVLMLHVWELCDWHCIAHVEQNNQLAKAVQKQVKLGIVDLTRPAKLHVDAVDTDMSGVLVQGTNNSYRIISMVGRELQITEAKCNMIEHLALTAAWCMK